ncbi:MULTISPECIES: aldo/keto reductase family oxidoreductase [unclassified Pantoea]|uniref:aldo/keto reductase family oxidoreductase n=1 Tax=unclassified Pantoea TaxID=2630326 RepID=UPI001232EF2A|nr:MULTISPECIES: aldo/keto reductase family oxidoreductase [unclassified Pantoea]KAA5974509.1 aldo/keto reductase family oxidoreductase [Pantoea sp. M_6]KAA5978228.1 aldo/keto reductase family oxidoreductase [Pantoea sp. M_8]KAA5990017.1 aldo/keto reductase family oxidoreductase [Pantoea sp. M_10]KAA6002758.1 aldo/keto reductase family oxidoreductase [Pantoea sp. M_5]
MSDTTMTFKLGDREVNRLGYGAMQLAGPGVFGPVKDEARAIQVLRDAIEAGVNHIDTSDFYGPHETNKLIRKALHPYPEDLCIVTKVGARRDARGGWQAAMEPEALTQAVEDNLRHLGLDVLNVVNLRSMLHPAKPKEGSLAPQLEALLALQARGLIRHIGLSNVTATQIAEARAMTPIVCVQNMYNLAHRQDDELVDQLAQQGIAWVPFFPLGGFSPLQSEQLNEVAASLNATPMQVALAWLLRRSPNILLIPGTSSPAHLQENLASRSLVLSDEVMAKLNTL